MSPVISCAMDSTHNEHDAQHEELYNHAADAIDYFWNFAEKFGISDASLWWLDLILVERTTTTPRTAKTMADWQLHRHGGVAAWGNRVVGVTDGLHNALKINPSTLNEDPTNEGVLLHQSMYTKLCGVI